MTPNQLLKAVADRKSIAWGPSGHRTPAAVIQNWQFRQVMNHIHTFTIYKPKKTSRYARQQRKEVSQ